MKTTNLPGLQSDWKITHFYLKSWEITVFISKCILFWDLKQLASQIELLHCMSHQANNFLVT